jgi:hypothetical protein
MDRRRFRTSRIAVALLVAPFLLVAAACGDDSGTTTTARVTTSTTSTTVTDYRSTTATTKPAEPTTTTGSWGGDAQAAVEAIQGHLDSVHGSDPTTAKVTGVAVDPATGVASVETSLGGSDTDAANTLCVNASMVAFSAPASVTRLDVTDGNGNVLVTATKDAACSAA